MGEEGVPQDLIYLAVAESGFQPRAVNRASRAGGMWQFMPRGNYGLTRNAYVDERFDPEKSTRAYARYMKYIYDQLGDWYLSMAGYDWGTGNVQRAVAEDGLCATSGSSTSATTCPRKPRIMYPRFLPPSSSPTIPHSTALTILRLTRLFSPIR